MTLLTIAILRVCEYVCEYLVPVCCSLVSVVCGSIVRTSCASAVLCIWVSNSSGGGVSSSNSSSSISRTPRRSFYVQRPSPMLQQRRYAGKVSNIPGPGNTKHTLVAGSVVLPRHVTQSRVHIFLSATIHVSPAILTVHKRCNLIDAHERSLASSTVAISGDIGFNFSDTVTDRRVGCTAVGPLFSEDTHGDWLLRNKVGGLTLRSGFMNQAVSVSTLGKGSVNVVGRYFKDKRSKRGEYWIQGIYSNVPLFIALSDVGTVQVNQLTNTWYNTLTTKTQKQYAALNSISVVTGGYRNLKEGRDMRLIVPLMDGHDVGYTTYIHTGVYSKVDEDSDSNDSSGGL